MKDDDPFKKYPSSFLSSFLLKKHGTMKFQKKYNRDNKIKDQHNKWILTPQEIAVQPQIVHTHGSLWIQVAQASD